MANKKRELPEGILFSRDRSIQVNWANGFSRVKIVQPGLCYENLKIIIIIIFSANFLNRHLTITRISIQLVY
jgi:hypothetical protein